MVSALLALVNNTLGGREDVERGREEADRRNRGESEKKISLACGGLAGQQLS